MNAHASGSSACIVPVAFAAAIARGRISASSATAASIQSCGPVSAASAAAWATPSIASACHWKAAVIRSITAAGPTAKPMRHAAIPWVFEKLRRTRVRSASSGCDAGERWGRPSKRTPA